MSDIGPAFVTHLSGITAVTNLIAADGITRLYPQYVREADRTYPYVLYHVTTESIEAFDGPGEVERARIELAAVTPLNTPDAIAVPLSCRRDVMAETAVSICSSCKLIGGPLTVA